MCWSCNPYCGGCKPPKPKPRKCSCGKFSFEEKAVKCSKCGADLPEIIPPQPVMCLFIGQICANPCKRSTTPPEGGEVKECNYWTPLKEA